MAQTKTTGMTMQHPDGIYFGLPEGEYHADTALGSTDLKDIAVDPVDWQFERLFGEKRNDEAPHLVFGKALHCRVLEGREAFEARFVRDIEKPSTALVTMDDMREWMKARGAKPSANNKGELIDKVLALDPGAQIWDVMKDGFERDNVNKTILTRKQFLLLELAVEWMQADETLYPIMENGSFKFGAPEVSVFYTDNGVRLKARFDWLMAHAVIDVKSFAPVFRERHRQSIIKAIMRLRYDLQAADYVRAWHKARDLWAAGKVYGADLGQRTLLNECYVREYPQYLWVFLKSTSAPQPYVRRFGRWQDEDGKSVTEMVFSLAVEEVERAISTYRAMVAMYGADKPWPAKNAPENIETTDFPAYFGASA